MTDNKKTVLAGSFLSQPMADLLTLRSVYAEQSKSSLLRGLITSYLMSGPTAEDMCLDIAQRYLKMWRYIDNYKKYPWNEYLKKIKDELEKYGIAKEHIEQILKYTDELREELKNGTDNIYKYKTK